MSRYLLLLTIFFSSNIWSYPDITIINDNKDYLLVEENALPIIDVNLTINTGSRDDDKIIGLTAFSFALLQEQVLKNEKITKKNIDFEIVCLCKKRNPRWVQQTQAGQLRLHHWLPKD